MARAGVELFRVGGHLAREGEGRKDDDAVRQGRAVISSSTQLAEIVRSQVHYEMEEVEGEASVYGYTIIMHCVKLAMAPPFTAMPTLLEISARLEVPMVVPMSISVVSVKSDVINGGVFPVPPAEARAEQ